MDQPKSSSSKTLLIVAVIVIVVIILLVLLSYAYDDSSPVTEQAIIMEPPEEPSVFGPEGDIEFGRKIEMKVPVRESRRQRVYNLKPAKHSWSPAIYKREALLYGVRTTPTQVLQESFDGKQYAETMALSLQSHFGPERIVYAVENDKGNLTWEYFFYGVDSEYNPGKPQTTATLFKTSNPDFEIGEYMQFHNQFMPKDARMSSTLEKENLSAFSIRVSEDGLAKGVTDQFNLHYLVDEEISSPCKGVHKKLTADGNVVETGYSIIFCPSCMHDFVDQGLEVGLSDLDIATLNSFVGKEIDYEPKFIRVSNNQSEMSVHLIGVPGSGFYKFLAKYDYPDFLANYVQSNLVDLDNFNHEIAFDFQKGGGQVPIRTRFYGIF